MAGGDPMIGQPMPDALLAQASGYGFVQLVRLLDRPGAGQLALGRGSDPTRETVSFRAKVGFAFSSGDVEAAACYGERTRVDVAFMTLAGNEGPLAPPYAEIVLQRARQDGAAAAGRGAAGRPNDDARDFLDIFNHRLLSYFYRGRKKHSIAVGAHAPGGVALLERLLFQLIGYHEGSTPAARQDGARALLRYAGILAAQERSLAGLQTMLADALGCPVTASTGAGRWLPIDPAERSTIGASGANRTLGPTRCWAGAPGTQPARSGWRSVRWRSPSTWRCCQAATPTGA